MIRKEIQAIIQQHPNNPEQAAIAVCVLLEEKMDMWGNGWFDGDREVQIAIQQHYENVIKKA